MWPFSRAAAPTSQPTLFLTNTRSGKKEPFVPLKPGQALLYSCGPTVYSRAHIGNLRQYVFSDTLARVLASNGYKVRRVINITDVGHLTGDNLGDADTGEDRMEKSARSEGTSASAIADRYTELFMADIRALGISTTAIHFPKATQYIAEQISLITALEKKGHTYRTPDGIYFDTTSFPAYGALGGVATAATAHARIVENTHKRHPADFALWRFSPTGVRRQQEWQSPWGRGFPGWHIECSAMAKALLGTQIDIHTGGVDHIAVHHNDEIAQSEAASGKTFASYWLHGAFLTVQDERIGKSMGNALYVSDLEKRGLHPLALRYLFLQAHYRSPLSFSWEAVTAAQEALTRLWRLCREARTEAAGERAPSEAAERFASALRDDLGTPRAIALLWESLRDDTLRQKALWGLIEDAEQALGLSLTNPPAPAETPITSVPHDVREMVALREAARRDRNFTEADRLRIHIEERGYRVDDRPEGPVVSKK